MTAPIKHACHVAGVRLSTCPKQVGAYRATRLYAGMPDRIRSRRPELGSRSDGVG